MLDFENRVIHLLPFKKHMSDIWDPAGKNSEATTKIEDDINFWTGMEQNSGIFGCIFKLLFMRLLFLIVNILP